MKNHDGASLVFMIFMSGNNSYSRLLANTVDKSIFEDLYLSSRGFMVTSHWRENPNAHSYVQSITAKNRPPAALEIAVCC